MDAMGLCGNEKTFDLPNSSETSFGAYCNIQHLIEGNKSSKPLPTISIY